jgi:hypothetical protein
LFALYWCAGSVLGADFGGVRIPGKKSKARDGRDNLLNSSDANNKNDQESFSDSE